MPALHPCPDGVLRDTLRRTTLICSLRQVMVIYTAYSWATFVHSLCFSVASEWSFGNFLLIVSAKSLLMHDMSDLDAICSPEECVNVLDGTVESGETFTLAVSSYLQYNDVFRYAYTTPAVMDEKIVFIEGLPADEVITDTRLVFFTVYNYGALLAILLVIFLTIGVHYTRKYVIGTNKISSLSWGDLLGSALVVLGFSLVTTYWNAAYNGNNSVTTGPRETTITQVLQQIQSGLRTILLGKSTTFYEGDLETLFGAGNYTLLDDINERLECLCSNPETLSMFYTPETYRFAELSAINKKCRLHNIQPGAQRLPTTWLDYSVRSGDNFNFVLAKNTSRSTIEKMNWLLLTVYSADNQATIHLRRAVPNVGMALTSSIAPYVDGRPFSVQQIELPLIFYFIGLAISFATLALEVVYLPFFRRLSREIRRESFALPV